jgi:hypothetical protein
MPSAEEAMFAAVKEMYLVRVAQPGPRNAERLPMTSRAPPS